MPLQPMFGNTISSASGQQAGLAVAVAQTYELAVPASAATLDLHLTTSATAGGVLLYETQAAGAGAVWTQVIGLRLDTAGQAPTTSSPSLAASTGYHFRIPVSGAAKVRLRVTTALGAALADLSYAFLAEPVGLLATGGMVPTPYTPSSYSLTTVATTNAAVVRAQSAVLQEITISNPQTTAANVKLYNKSSAPTVGTDVPVMTIPVAAGTATQAVIAALSFGGGKRFSTGIALAVTGGPLATDTAATVAGIQISASYI